MSQVEITLISDKSPTTIFTGNSKVIVSTDSEEDELLKVRSDDDKYSDAGSEESRLLEDESLDLNIATQSDAGSEKQMLLENEDSDGNTAQNLVFDEMAAEKNQQSGSTKKRKRTQKIGNPLRQSIERVNLILIGKTGVGKSIIGNIILGENRFDVSNTAHLVTRECQEENRNINNVSLNIVDTPGLFSLEMENSIVQAKIREFLKNRPHMWPLIFVLCIKAVRFTKEDKQIINIIEDNYGTRIYENMVVIITGRKPMVNTDHDMQEWLKLLLKKIENRTFYFQSDSAETNNQLTLFLNTCQNTLNKTENLNYNLSDYDTAQRRIREKKGTSRFQMLQSVYNTTTNSPPSAGKKRKLRKRPLFLSCKT